MKVYDQLQLLIRVVELIRREATGTAKELGKKIGKSERNTFRYIEELKDSLDIPIVYCKTRKTYRMERKVKIVFKIEVLSESEKEHYQGGQKNYYVFLPSNYGVVV